MSATSALLYSSAPDLTNLANGPFTLSCWFQPSSTISAATIVDAPTWQISMDDVGLIHFTTVQLGESGTTGPTDLASASATPVSSGAWNYIAVTWDGVSVMTLCLNGLITTLSGVAPPTRYSQTQAYWSQNFQLGDSARQNASASSSDTSPPDAEFDLCDVIVWSRALSVSEINSIYANGGGNVYPLLGGPANFIWQANLIATETSPDTPETPVIVATNSYVWSLTPQYDTGNNEYVAAMDVLFQGNEVSDGYTWTADNFNNVIVMAEHDNPAQYWLPPYPNVMQPLPGLPVNNDVWDGVCVFAGHVILWQGQTLQWSDLNNFAMWIPVGETAVSAVLTLANPFVQPAPGATVAVTVNNPASTSVGSVTLSGNLSFGSVTVNTSSSQVLNILNTGTTPVTVTGITLPAGFSGQFSGEIPVNGSVPVVITFTPTEAQSYGGFVTAAATYTTQTYASLTSNNATTEIVPVTLGLAPYPISGTGAGNTYTLSTGGILDFGDCKVGKTLASSLILTNTGNQTVNVSSISLPTGFSISSGGWSSGNIASGAVQTVPITFSPLSVQSYTGNIVVNSNATGTVSIGVSGTGESTVGGRVIFLTDNGTCQFGNVTDGDNGNGTITAYNPSLNTITIIGVTLPSGFTTSYTHGTLAAFSSVEIPVTFSPNSPGSYGGLAYLSFSQTGVQGTNSVTISGTGIVSGAAIQLGGNLNFGDVPIGSTLQAYMVVTNNGTASFTIESGGIVAPTGFTVGAYNNSVAAGTSQNVPITFSPAGSPQNYSGNITVTLTSDITGASSGYATIAVGGTSFSLPQPASLVTGQYVTLTDSTNGASEGVTYYNIYTVVSQVNTLLTLQAVNTTGATPAGLTQPADGRQFFTVDANEAGTTEVVGAQMNGPIYTVVPLGNYAYIFKEWSIQSIQYTGIGNGVFYILNEVFGEGPLAPTAVLNRNDGIIIFLGHKQLYAYQGGPNLTPVCEQTTNQLYSELDRSRITSIRMFLNDLQHEVWVKYPVVGGFRVMIWNYLEDSATFDDYNPYLEFTALGLVDWATGADWNQLPVSETWASISASEQWESIGGGALVHTPILASQSGQLMIFGLNYDRDGESYVCTSDTMDFDFGDGDIWKYCDSVVIGLQVLTPVLAGTTMQVQVCGQGSLGEPMLDYNPDAPQQTGMWSAPQTIYVDGTQPVPVKVNPGGAGRYFRVRFTSSQVGVQWRVSSFEINTRQGGLY